MSLAKSSSTFQKLITAKLSACIVKEQQQSYVRKRQFSSKKLSLQLLPEVEQLLDDGTLKHRKHPGVNKIAPIVVPTNLIAAVDKLLATHSEKALRNEANELLTSLSMRRLPMEKDEMDFRIMKHVGGDEEALDLMSKKDIRQLRKEIITEASRWKPIEYTYHTSLAYLIGRLAANYASALKIFSQIKSEVPSFQPKTFLDFGSGIGSAVWAANCSWADSLQEYFCVDSSPDMNEISETLLTDEKSGETIFKNLYHRQFLPASDTIKYDLVVSAFSLMDLPSTQDRLKVIDTLWRKTNDLLVVIEFGNFAGFFSVLDARDYILQIEKSPTAEFSLYSSGAHVLMPCPHDSTCPMLQFERKKSCGTYVLYESVFPRHSQICKRDWISYVVLRKGHRSHDSHPWPRIVKPVLKKSGHVHCRACCSGGNLNDFIVTKRQHGRHLYRCVRSCSVGDTLPINIEPSKDFADNEESEEPDNE